MKEAKYLIVVGGPTASGKTELALRLALHFNTQVLSCDSRQFYRQLNIGTAKPGPELLKQVTHHFIDHLSVEQTYSAGDYVRDALKVLQDLFQTRQHAILAGGSGLYQKALCEGLDAFPQVPRTIREQLEADYRQGGIQRLQAELSRKDPDYFAEVDTRNPARLLRALAVIRSSGKPYSAFRTGRAADRPFQPVYLWLHWPRHQLYDRINARVDQMMTQGLLDEVRSLLPFRHLDALQTVGYKELFAFLDGTTSLEEAVGLIKQNTRRYAKRQITWRRRDAHWTLLRPGAWEETLQYIDLLTRQGIRLQIDRSEGITALSLLSPDGLCGQCWFRPGKAQTLAAGPFFTKPSPDPWLARALLQQMLRRLPAGRVFSCSPPLAKPFLLEAGFDRVAQVPAGMGALLAAVGRTTDRLEVYCKNA